MTDKDRLRLNQEQTRKNRSNNLADASARTNAGLSSRQAEILQWQQQQGNSEVLRRLADPGDARHVQRLKVDLEGWGGGPWDSSDMEINPVVSVGLSKPQVDPGKPIAFDQSETINLPLGAEGFIYLTAWASIMEDNVSLWPISTNGHNKYRFYAKWWISVDQKGKVTIGLPEKEYEGGGNISWTLTATPVQDEKSKAVGMDFELLDKKTNFSGWSGNISIGGKIKDEITGGAGVTYTKSSGEVSPNVVGRSIRVNIVTPEPLPPEPHGEVTVSNQVSAWMEVPFYFDKEGQKELKGEELDKLINFFTKGSGALADTAREALVKGEEEIIIDGYASTTGIEAKNVFEYSEGRAQHVSDLIRKKLGEKANIKRGEAHGSSQAKEKGPKREERKVIVKFWWRNY